MQEYKTLEHISFQTISEVFNKAFSDYFFKVEWTKEQFEEKFQTEGGRLDLSVGVFEDNKLVAFILNFFNTSSDIFMNYNGGTGVVPGYRGNHLTSKMYDFLLPKLRKNRVEKMILEVLTQNAPAIKTYKRQGFKITRELNLFKGKLSGKENLKLSDSYKVGAIEKMDWDHIQTFWDYPPTWQNSISTMIHLEKKNICLGIEQHNVTVGYIIYNPKHRRIHQMAVDKKFRNIGLGGHLLNSIYSLEKESISCINIDSNNQTFEKFLMKRGLKKFGSQFEMKLELNQNDH